MKLLAVLLATTLSASNAMAADYVIDTQGAHASINFEIPHLGYSILVGRFDNFEGTFSYDAEKPESSRVAVTIDVASLNSNHPERDKHLRSKQYLHVSDYPQAEFKSTSYTATSATEGKLKGNLTLRGITKEVVIDVVKVGEGDDPWGGYRAGFSGETALTLADFGIPAKLGPASEVVTLSLHIEGIRQ